MQAAKTEHLKSVREYGLPPTKRIVYTSELPTKNGIAKLDLPNVTYLAAKFAIREQAAIK